MNWQDALEAIHYQKASEAYYRMARELVLNPVTFPRIIAYQKQAANLARMARVYMGVEAPKGV